MPSAPLPALEAPTLAEDAQENARLEALFDEYLVSRKPEKPSRNTMDAWRNDFAQIRDRLAGLAGVAPAELRVGYLSARALRHAFAGFAEDHAGASIARAWSTWNRFFGFLVAEEVVQGNPMAAVGRPKTPRSSPKPLQGEDTIERLLEFLAGGGRPARNRWPERDLAFIATDLLTGCRLSELLDLDLGSFDGREGERRIKVVGKGRKERFVPIEAPLEATLAGYLASRQARFAADRLGPRSPLFVGLAGERLRRGAAQYLVGQCYRHAGIGARVPKGALVHALRHSMATRLAEDGASATEIQRLLGHESLNTSQGYIDATANAQRAAAKSNRTYQSLDRLLTGKRP